MGCVCSFCSRQTVRTASSRYHNRKLCTGAHWIFVTRARKKHRRSRSNIKIRRVASTWRAIVQFIMSAERQRAITNRLEWRPRATRTYYASLAAKIEINKLQLTAHQHRSNVSESICILHRLGHGDTFSHCPYLFYFFIRTLLTSLLPQYSDIFKRVLK